MSECYFITSLWTSSLSTNICIFFTKDRAKKIFQLLRHTDTQRGRCFVTFVKKSLIDSALTSCAYYKCCLKFFNCFLADSREKETLFFFKSGLGQLSQEVIGDDDGPDDCVPGFLVRDGCWDTGEK